MKNSKNEKSGLETTRGVRVHAHDSAPKCGITHVVVPAAGCRAGAVQLGVGESYSDGMSVAKRSAEVGRERGAFQFIPRSF